MAESSAPPIVRAKLHRPALLPNSLLRPRLVERLEKGLRRRLLLIAAPAGYGKTTLLAQWLATREAPPTLAWLTLDEADNEPRRFLAYLAATLPALGAAGQARASAALGALAPPVSEVVLADLLNDLAELPHETVIVLDRASAWYAAHGMLTDAVDHALKAGAVDDVVALIEPVGLALATRVGEATLRSWLPGIPPAVARSRRLSLI